MNRPSWDGRIGRAAELAKDYGFAAEALSFYQWIARFQKDLYGHLETAPAANGPNGAWPESIDCRVLPWFSPFLSLVEQVGTRELAQSAARLRGEGEERWSALLSAYWAGERPASPSDVFLARAFLQPYAEYIAAPAKARGETRGATCPVCGGKPQVGVLRPEGYGARRSLVCSFCLTEWDYRRIVCPACGVDVFDDLPVYTASEFEHVRVETCDHCRTYIKTVDLTKNGLAVPIVDELATIPLDLWAQGKGYVKLERNLLGL